MKHIPSNASPEELRRVFLKLQEEVSKLQSNSATQQASVGTPSQGQGQGNGNNSQPITAIMTLHTEFSGTPSDLTIDEDGRAVLKQVQVREVAG